MLGPSLIVSSPSSLQAKLPFQTHSGKTATRWLRNRSLGFSKICIDPSGWDEDLLTLLYEARLHRPVTPVYLLGNSDGLSPSDFHRLGITGRLDASKLATETSQSLQPLSQGSSLREEGDYLGIPVADFLELESLGLDIFIKSPQGKWVLMAHAGEPGIGERIRTYWSRGLSMLYIQRQSLRRQLDAIRMFSALLPTAATGSGVLKTAQALRHASRVLEGIRSIEQVDQEAWAAIGQSVERLHRVWDAGPWSDPQHVLQNTALLDHSLSVMVLSQLLGRELGFKSEENAIRLGLASAFHDIGLLDLGIPLPSEENPQALDPLLNATQRQLFLDHPARGAQWIHDHFEGESVVAQAIALHHWRRDGSGFYSKEAGEVMDAPRLAEVIGLSELAAYELLKSPVGTPSSWAANLADRLENQFSAPVLEALRHLFERRIRIS
jgi:hypothetical protein